MFLRLFISLSIVVTCLFQLSLSNIDVDESTNNLLKPTAEQKSALQKTVKALLDFKRLPRPGEVIRPVSRTANAASKYMHKLFEQYRQDGQLGHAEGNIVRSISPQVGEVDGQDALIFKLNTIKPDEVIIRAELHYNHRHHHYYKQQQSAKLSKRRRAAIEVIGAASTHNNNRLPLIAFSADWLSWDASELVASTLASIAANRTIDSGNAARLVLHFIRNNRRMPSAQLIQRNTPFLLVFSDAPSLIDKEQVQSAMQNDNHRTRRSTTNYYAYSDRDDDNDNAKQREQQRAHIEQFKSVGPRLLQSRKELKQRRRKQQQQPSKLSTNERAYRRDDGDDDDVTVVLLDGVGSSAHSRQKCTKHNLVVQFRDIGWMHWIIEPKSFELNYCAGSCIPLAPEVNPSNHAIVQTMIHTIGLHPYVPDVCCAPDSMDSLTLLYFDEDDNVVLKNYPKMTVTSCGCL